MIADMLRKTVMEPGQPGDPLPPIPERVNLVGSDLLAIADALERGSVVDPGTVLAVNELLCSATASPLFNANRSTFELVQSVRRARVRLEIAP